MWRWKESHFQQNQKNDAAKRNVGRKLHHLINICVLMRREREGNNKSMCAVVGCNMRDCICKSIFIAENCNNVIKCGKYIQMRLCCKFHLQSHENHESDRVGKKHK